MFIYNQCFYSLSMCRDVLRLFGHTRQYSYSLIFKVANHKRF